MAKKSIDSKHQAFAHKGAKAPKPSSASKGEVKSTKLEPSKGSKPDMGKDAAALKASAEMASKAPAHKGSAHSSAEASSQFSGLNGGKDQSCEHLQGHDVKSKK